MKFLIYNYASPWSTEPLYFHASLNLLPKNVCSASMYNTNISVYDNFDLNKPDYVITKSTLIDKDFLSYISSNPNLNILINVTDINENELVNFSDKINSLNSNITLFGNKHISLKNYIQLLPSADIFIQSSIPQFKINKLIFVKQESDICELDGSYHYTTENTDLSKNVDFILPITDLHKIFPNYDEIIFKHIDYIGTQIAFNAIYSGTKVIFETNDQNYTDRMNAVFKGNKQLNAVKNKHTCLHRLKTLVNHLGLNDVTKHLDPVLEKI